MTGGSTRGRWQLLLLTGALISCAAPSTPAPTPPPAPSLARARQTLEPATGVDQAALDPSVSACEDLYLHACGGWLSQADVPSSRQWLELDGERIGRRRREITHTLVAASTGTPHGAATPSAALTAAPQRLFQACIDEDAIERAGVRPLSALLGSIDQITDAQSLGRAVAALHQSGVDALFRLGPSVERATPDVWTWRLSAAESSGPPADSSDPLQANAGYEMLVTATLERLGGATSQPETRQAALAGLKLERLLARAVSTETGTGAPALSAAAPFGASFDWSAYLLARGLSPSLSPSTPSSGWLTSVTRALASTPLPGLKAYLKWRVAKSLTLALPRGIRDPIATAFPDAGETVPKPRRDQCIRAVERSFRAELSRAFAAAALNPEAMRLAETLARASVESFEQLLSAASGLSVADRTALGARLRSVGFQLGSGRPEPPLKLPAGADFGVLMLATHSARIERDVQRASAPPDRQLMPVPASTPNMFYHPALRAVIVPAGYLLPPNFDPAAALASNSARAGFGLAHELAHAFDADWLKQHASCVRADLSSSALASGLPAAASLPRFDGQTLARVESETLADVVGIRVAYQAHLTTQARAATQTTTETKSTARAANQLFWLNYAQSQCRKATTAGEAWLLQHDPHLPNHARVNYTARSAAQFAADFGCEAPAPMAEGSSCEW